MLNEEPDASEEYTHLEWSRCVSVLTPVAVLTDGFKIIKEAGRDSCLFHAVQSCTGGMNE